MKKQTPPNKQPEKKSGTKIKPMVLAHYFPLKPIHCFGIISVLTFVLYVNSLWNDYALDDSIVIKENMYTQKGFAGIKDIMSSDVFVGFFKTEKSLVAGGRYRPLSVVTFAMEHSIFGNNPGASHFINLLLYALTGIAMFIFLTRLFSFSKFKLNHWLPLLSTLLFIAHPLHTEAVTNIKGRDEIMTLLFTILAGNYFLKYYDSQKIISLLIASVCFFAALLSKENAITWIAIFPLLFYFFREFDWKKSITPFIATIIIAGIYLTLRQTFTNTSIDKEVTEILNNPFYGATAAQKFATIIYTFGRYLLLLIFPHPLTHDYYFNQIPLKNFSDVSVIFTIIIYSFLAIIAIMGFSKKSLLSFCIIYFAATFSVVSNLFFPVGTTMSERFLYMSSFSFSIYCGYLLLQLMNIFKQQNTDGTIPQNLLQNKMVLGIISFILVAYSFKTIARNPAWKDNYTLFSTDVKTSPNSAKLNNALGGTALEFLDMPEVSAPEKRKYTDQAIAVTKKAISIYPEYSNAWLLLGNAYLKGDSNYIKAADCYIQTLKINRYYSDGKRNLLVAMMKIKDPTQRVSFIKNYYNENPGNTTIGYMYAGECNRAGLVDTAISVLNHVVKLEPDYALALNDLGLIYGQKKNMIDSSIYFLTKSVEADPKLEDANDNLAVAYGIKGEYQKALAVLLNAVQLSPNHAKYYLSLGTTYSAMGDMNSAGFYFDKARTLDPELMKNYK